MLAGQILCPRSPPDALAMLAKEVPPEEEWVVNGLCAYVPQVRYPSLPRIAHSDFDPGSLASERFNQR